MDPDHEHGAGAPPQPMLTVAAVARRLGVAPSTLRTWDRRYHLGPSTHTAGAHRRYSARDLARLVVMRGLVQQGVPPAEAAQIALSTPASQPAAQPPTPPPPTPQPPTPQPPHTPGRNPLTTIPMVTNQAWSDDGLLNEADGYAATAMDLLPDPVPDRDAALPIHPQVTAPGPHRTPSAPTPMAMPGVGVPGAGRSGGGPGLQGLVSRPGGGRVVALPDGSPQARGLARAAMSLNTPQVARLLREAVHADGVVAAWQGLAMPVLQAIGDRWQATGEGLDVEHAFCEALLSVLRGVAESLERPRNVGPVLLTCAEGEQHSLPLHVLAAALAEVGVGCTMLGTGMPAHALIAAVRRTGPAVVFIYAQQPVADPGVLEQLTRQRPTPRVALGGPGWEAARLPGSALRVDTLSAAVAAVVSAIHA